MVDNNSRFDGQYNHRADDQRWPKLHAPWPKMPMGNRGVDPVEAIRIVRLRSQIVHGAGRYTYPGLTAETWAGSRMRITIHCNKCRHMFEQDLSDHLRRSPRRASGCPRCGEVEAGLAHRVSWEQFRVRAAQQHGKRYTYLYPVGSWCGVAKSDVVIECLKHGNFIQTAASHLYNGTGCPQCAWENLADSKRKGHEQFLCDARAIHGDEYEYLGEYVHSQVPMSMRCNLCDSVFEQTPTTHLSGSGCPVCAKRARDDARRKTKKQFIEEARAKHGNRYNYPGEYINTDSKTIIYCNKCGHTFHQIPAAHLSGRGCPRCRSSHGERAVYRWLEEHGFEFEAEVRASHLFGVDNRNGGRLRYDVRVYVPTWIIPAGYILLEIDGSQHRRPIGFGGDPQALFAKIQSRDKRKNNLATENGVILRRLNYDAQNEGVGPLLERLERTFQAMGLISDDE